VCESTTDPTCINDERYLECVQDINKDLVTATAAITAFSSMAMGIFTNLPVALGPGMGLNVYFTYQVVGFHGTGNLSYQSALMVVFVQGLVFFLISLLGLRQWLGRAIPASLKMAAAAGIGLYITLIGLTYSAGIGAITGGRSDPLTLGGCTPDLIDPVSGMCKSGQLRNPTMWLGIFAGGIFTAFLMLYRVKGAIIFGILLVSIASWPRGTPVTTFPYTPLGDSSFDFFKQVVTFHPIKHIFGVIDWDITSGETVQFLVALITFLYVDILDLTGTLYSMAKFCGALNEETQDFEGSSEAYIVDAVSISLGAFVGCPPITAFIESGAGIAEGGKTGLTACVTGLCFFVSIFFAPIFASIPPWATGCTLILVGSMMARAVVDINWGYVGDAVPAFLTLAIMPFTYVSSTQITVTIF
jgi:AGZA family xanthine/uracil permease-like MFS transporter